MPGTEVVTVNAQTFTCCAREQLPDGTFEEELCTLGEGGRWSRAVKEPWMDQLQFMDVARVVAGPLAKVNYRPALKTADAQLLILVFRGATTPPGGSFSRPTLACPGAKRRSGDRPSRVRFWPMAPLHFRRLRWCSEITFPSGSRKATIRQVGNSNGPT